MRDTFSSFLKAIQRGEQYDQGRTCTDYSLEAEDTATRGG